MRIAILGYGNIGKAAEQAILSAPNMELAGIYHHDDNLDNVSADVVLICTPTREMRRFATQLLQQGINVVDSFDVHTDIYSHRADLRVQALASNAVSVVSAGWDPGTDSVMRAIMLAMVPEGVTYTNFGKLGTAGVGQRQKGLGRLVADPGRTGGWAHPLLYPGIGASPSAAVLSLRNRAFCCTAPRGRAACGLGTGGVGVRRSGTVRSFAGRSTEPG